MASSPPLAYSPPPRRRTYRRLLWAVVLLALAIPAIRWAPRVTRTVSLLWWQHRCMNHMSAPLPSGLEVVVTRDPSKSHPPLPRGWTEFADAYGRARFPPVASEVINFLKASQLELLNSTDVLLFCHEMRTIAGEPRLVMVFARGNSSTAEQRVGNALVPFVFTRASPGRAPEVKGQLQPILNSNSQTAIECQSGFRLNEGAIDPDDPTRLLIPYQVDGQPGRIEGRLGKGELLRLKVLDGPAFEK